ncbi:MAG: zinc ribbon domain-containing protein [Erythrobacter sp.]|nr:MAG: zinc ribbon domain-containing protein [Erythrobacter sp.]
MTEVVRFRCLNCGHRFDTEVLTEEERREARREDRPTSPVHCPKCHRTDIRRGWE